MEALEKQLSKAGEAYELLIEEEKRKAGEAQAAMEKMRQEVSTSGTEELEALKESLAEAGAKLDKASSRADLLEQVGGATHIYQYHDEFSI